MPTLDLTPITPEQALMMWIKSNGITIKEFAEKMGYTYAHAIWVASGSTCVTYDMLGRMVIAYGSREADKIARRMPKIKA